MKNKIGVCNTNANTLKTMSTYIVELLVKIFNFYVEQSVWPETLDLSEHVLIFNATDKHQVLNYRPIYLILNFAKLLKR